jgi:diaminohydroxyphosphoribosylaminopyrimidine deaminase/5-amino-6-(5-phosphoribosylamino)uracil reductase
MGSDLKSREDERWMRRAIRLAQRFIGQTAPNPAVGAMVVKDGICLGRGAHPGAGGPHAEVIALQEAGERAQGATLYVTLEPCNHYGRTPPCTEAIIRSGIRQVVVGTRDPNPEVRGGGVEALREAGIEVRVGVLEEDAKALIADFRVWVEKKRPFFIYKVASTWDGTIAFSEKGRERITSPKSQRYVHRLRTQVDAVMVGKRTYLRDDPDLRPYLLPRRRSPWRIVISSHLVEPRGKLALHEPEKVWMIAGEDPLGVAPFWRERSARVTLTGEIPPDPRTICRILWEEGVYRVLLEGGATLAGSFLRAGVLDWLILGFGPILSGGTPFLPIFAGPPLPRDPHPSFTPMRVERIGEDLWVSGPIRSIPSGG